MEKYKRVCPQCNKTIFYKSIRGVNIANTRNGLCNDCNTILRKEKKKLFDDKNGPFIRHCPKCGRNISYLKHDNFLRASKKDTGCLICYKEGSNNVMYGKTVFDIWTEKYGKTVAQQMLNEQTNNKKETWKNKSQIELKQHDEKISKSLSGKKNPMYGKSVYEHWITKYGLVKADELKEKRHIKIHNRINGENNPMFGKPPSYKSGSGWSGHYHNIQFRSLLELHYLIYLIDNNIKFENGELKKHQIPYIMNNVNRNYLPDYYLVDTDQTIEIKPKKLITTYQNKLKFAAAKEKLGNKHVILNEEDIIKIDLQILYDKYISKELIFDERYAEKFEQYCNKGKKDKK